ncbi:MAG: site-2 protease family protein [Acidimicrobiales bacterium]
MIPGRSQSGGSTVGTTFRVAGFPTRVRPTFLILIALVGWYPDITAARMAIWVVVASAAIMWHELGHARAARRLGASPTIELYGFGGATMWRPPTDPTRWQLIGVSFAGPLAGFSIGAVLGVGVALAGGVGTGDVRYFVLAVLWTNVGWGLVNLLPVLPLDGGHILAELLPGDRATRNRRAAVVSIVVAGIAIVWLASIGIVFGALILGWIVMTNLSTLNVQRAAGRRTMAEDAARDALTRLGHGEATAVSDIERMLADLRPQSAAFRAVAIETAAATGDAAGARRLLDSAPIDEPLSPGLYALVFAAESQGRDGIGELVEILRREPTARHARWLAIALRWGGRLDDLPTILASLAGRLDGTVLDEAATVAAGLGNPAVAEAVRALGRA